MDIQIWKRRKKQLNLTYDDLAKISGISKRTIAGIFGGDYKYESPTLNTVEAIERALGLNEKSPAIKGEVELNDNYLIPLLGEVVAGVPMEAQENLEGYIYISYRPKEEYFALRVHGESMKNAGIPDKSIIVCHKQEVAENGEIVVALINREQTVKRYKQYGNQIFLMPENPDFEPIAVTPSDELLILGKVVEVRVSF